MREVSIPSLRQGTPSVPCLIVLVALTVGVCGGPLQLLQYWAGVRIIA